MPKPATTSSSSSYSSSYSSSSSFSCRPELLLLPAGLLLLLPVPRPLPLTSSKQSFSPYFICHKHELYPYSAVLIWKWPHKYLFEHLQSSFAVDNNIVGQNIKKHEEKLTGRNRYCAETCRGVHNLGALNLLSAHSLGVKVIGLNWVVLSYSQRHAN